MHFTEWAWQSGFKSSLFFCLLVYLFIYLSLNFSRPPLRDRNRHFIQLYFR